MVQILPGVDQYLREGIQKLGDTISLFTETDRKTQRAIRDMLIQNPSLIPQFADLEHRSPGTLKKMGFGSKMAGDISAIGPSFELRKELALGDKEIDVDSQRLDVDRETLDLTQQKNRIINDILARNPQLTPSQIEAAFSAFAGVPRATELDIEEFARSVSELQSENAQVLLRALQEGKDLEGPLLPLVHDFMSGRDDPNVTSAILSHPTLGQQFGMLYDLLVQREAAMLRGTDKEPTKISELPVSLQNQFNQIAPLRGAYYQYEALVKDFMDLPEHRRALVVAGRGTDEEKALYGQIRSLQSGLMGAFRAVLLPGPMAAHDIRLLTRMLSNVTSITSFMQGPRYVEGQLDGVRSYLESRVYGLSSTYPKVEIPRIRAEDIPESLIRRLSRQGLDEEAILDELYRLGFDVYSDIDDTRGIGVSRTPPSREPVRDEERIDMAPYITNYLRQLQGGR